MVYSCWWSRKDLDKLIVNGYGNIKTPEQPFLSGHFLEHTANESLYVQRKKTFFYKESIISSFLQASLSKKVYVITSNELCEVLAFVEDSSMSHIWHLFPFCMFKTLVYLDVIIVIIYLNEVFHFVVLIQSNVMYSKNVIYYYKFSQKHFWVTWK